jgi:7-carboxy-7-deazaguanine synthase
VCTFCDTDFVGVDGTGGGKFASAQTLAAAVSAQWPSSSSPQVKRLVVCTGGEPLLQLDVAAVAALHSEGFEIAIETNGTQLPPAGIDWICVSPKADAPLRLTSGDELKLVFPQPKAPPERFLTAAALDTCPISIHLCRNSSGERNMGGPPRSPNRVCGSPI